MKSDHRTGEIGGATGAGRMGRSPVSPPRLPRKWRVAICVLLVVAIPAVDALLLEPNWPFLSSHEIGVGTEAVTVLHFTDVHTEGFGARERWALEQASALRPDLIVITGDTVAAPLTAARREAATRFLREVVALRPRLGVLACAGNHEDWAGPGALECYAEAGIPLLDHETPQRLLDGGLVVHGAGSAQDPLSQATDGFDLLLCHYPAVLPRAARQGYELILAGHAHGGQVRFPGLGSLWLPFDSDGRDQGWYTYGSTRMYVGRGLGTSILPIRFLCRPELAVFTIRLTP